MAHQLAPSVNCSLDEIDLSALKVYIGYYIVSIMLAGILHFPCHPNEIFYDNFLSDKFEKIAVVLGGVDIIYMSSSFFYCLSSLLFRKEKEKRTFFYSENERTSKMKEWKDVGIAETKKRRRRRRRTSRRECNWTESKHKNKNNYMGEKDLFPN